VGVLGEDIAGISTGRNEAPAYEQAVVSGKDVLSRLQNFSSVSVDGSIAH